MFDFHYDLLTKLYISYLNQDFCEIREICKAFRKDNVFSVVANLCFETVEEMKKEYHPNYWNPNVGILEMFYIATNLVSRFVSPEVDVIYSIEGCDYVELEDLPILYQMGLRSIIPVWNHQNQYGSGNRTNTGLTEKGKQLIELAITLGIAIDLSHANEETFDGIIEVIEKMKKSNKEVIFFASHSNVKTLCDVPRNLTEQQLLAIQRLGGKVGLFSNRNFVLRDALQNGIQIEQLKHAYLEQIRYVEKLFGGLDSIVLSTDDMGWVASSSNDPEFALLSIYPYSQIVQNLSQTLSKVYDEEEIKKLLYKNGIQLFNKRDVIRK
ncbi:MAG: hypothetical protein HFH08_05885 [Bacilli bacterium]|nr:hypothetical protein [Bacilli bacterium]